MDMPAIDPALPQALFLEATHIDPLKSGPMIIVSHGSGPIVGSVCGISETLAWSNWCLYMSKSTVAKARPILTTGVLVPSDVLQALSLQS